jgi:hypothetical protein
MGLREYMVVGIYDDDENTRVADSYETYTPEEAEELFQAVYGFPFPVTVAGVLTVVAGAIEVVA